MATITPRTPPPHEVLIDDDPVAAPEPPPRDPRQPLAKGTPPTPGHRGAPPQSRVVEETVPLGDLGVVTLRFDGELRHLHIYLGEEGMALDAKALDRLIAVLSAKRAQMTL